MSGLFKRKTQTVEVAPTPAPTPSPRDEEARVSTERMRRAMMLRGRPGMLMTRSAQTATAAPVQTMGGA